MIEVREIGGRLALFGSSLPPRDAIPDEAFRPLSEWLELIADGEQVQREQRVGFTESFATKVWGKHHRRDAERVGQTVEVPRSQRYQQPKRVDPDDIYARWNGAKK